VVRQEYANPGEFWHPYIKKLGRFWKFGHRAAATVSNIPAARAGRSSTQPSTMHPGWSSPACSRTSEAAASGLPRSGHRQWRRAFRRRCRRLGLRHIRTKPYATHQRQSRALYPNELARVGLAASLQRAQATGGRDYKPPLSRVAPSLN